ncbi:MAG: 23S rRNA (pseudouridine(1915)-N(3))-methyltransferase RlmH [Gemmatimonadota bacterium]|nr:23S rRNA (pseudouridine(1915)-N(3))-methyltransferase RlmH [Gemmatimonadota bacterium]
MKVLVLAVGKPRNAALALATTEYEERAARYWPLERVEVREEPAKSATSDLVRLREGERLEARIPPGAVIVCCDPGGKRLDSAAFSAWLQGQRESGRDVAFVIGGAYGLSPALLKRATVRLELAPWTLPHELARLVLAEQLYRAGTIVRREPYHK